MDINIYYNSTNLYPEHIYDWKLSGINCPTEDYSVGNVSQVIATFKTDTQISVGDTLWLESSARHLAIVTEVVKNKTAQVTYSVTARLGVSDIDAILPDSFFEDIAASNSFTLSNLFTKLKNEGYIDNVPALSINQNYQINKQFGYTGLTVRQVLQWACQLAGTNIAAFNTATTASLSSVTKFEPTTVIVPFQFTDSNIKSIDLAEYTVPQIDKIWFGTDSSDVGISYGSGENQMSMPYNPLIDGDTFLQPLYDRVHSLQVYTPMKIQTFSQADNLLSTWLNIQTFSWMKYTKNNVEYVCPIFSWEISNSGITLEGTGHSTRTAANANISNEIVQSGKYNKFKQTLDGTVSEVAALTTTVNGMTTAISQIAQTAAGITTCVKYDDVISSINQTAETITISANKINLNGAVEVGPSDSQPEAFLTITPSQADMAGQHSRVQLYNNSVYVNTYDTNDKKIAFSCQQGSAFGMHGLGEVNGVTYTYPDVYIFSRAADEANPAGSGFGNVFLYNGEWHRAHGITNPVDFKASAVLTAGSTTSAGGWLTLFDVDSNMVQHPNVELTSTGYGRLVLKDDGVYTISLDADNKGSMMLRPNSGTYPYAWYETNKVDMYSSATNKTHLGTDFLKVESNATTSSVLSASGVECYGDNGSGATARKGRYTGDVLTVGTAPSGTVYAELSPNKLTFWNSGETYVNKVVPQGASVIEHGTKTVSGNTWSYRKWSNGDYECWLVKEYTLTTSHTFGNQYYADIAAITYPTTFLSAPYEVVSVEGGTQTSSQNVSVYLSNASPGTSTTKSGAYLAMRPTNSVVNFWMDYFVKGKVSV